MTTHGGLVSAFVLSAGAILALGSVGACSKQASQDAVKTQPATPPLAASEPFAASHLHQNSPSPESAPAPVEHPATQPASKPATQPQPAKPESTYSSKPPYPVSLYVKDPDDKQPGWLKIEGLLDKHELATAQGRFPEQNRVYVTTNNVHRIRIEVGFLPLRPNQRVILQIDKQGMVLSRDRKYTTLERQPTGEWVILKEKK